MLLDHFLLLIIIRSRKRKLSLNLSSFLQIDIFHLFTNGSKTYSVLDNDFYVKELFDVELKVLQFSKRFLSSICTALVD